MSTEIWKQLLFNKNLAISNAGRLKTIATGQVWKLGVNKHGYNQVGLYVTEIKKSKTCKIHRLVAEYFLIPIPGKHHVNHKDFDKLNNNVDNLEWCTLRENIDHYYKHKHNHVITDSDVKFIRENMETIGARKLAKMLSLKEGYIYGVANGIHKGNIHKELIRAKRISLPKQVSKYSLDGILIEKYKSIREAAKKNNTRLSKIQMAISGERKTHGGFVYKCEEYRNHQKKIMPLKKNGRRIGKHDTAGNLIKDYKTMVEAANDNRISRYSIRDTLSGRYKTGGGFIWKYT